MTTFSRTLAAVLMLGAAVVAPGCASTAKGVQTSALRSGAMETLRVNPPAGTLLAVVRYPAVIDASAEDAFTQAFRARAIGGSVGKDADPLEIKAQAETMVLKSNYYAMSLYRELAARLPEHTVLLSPHEVTLADDGSLTSVPMTQAESLPSVVTVDFAAYTHPDIDAMMGSKPLTFGDLVTPLVSVRTDPRASVGTEGVLLASSPVRSVSAGTNRAQAIADLGALESGRLDSGVPELDLIAFLSGEPRATVASVPLTRRSEAAVRDYPIEKIRLQDAQITTLDDSQADILEVPFTNGFANQVVGMINGVDVPKAAMFKRAEAISAYDESLAALTLVGSDSADYRARERYADRLLEAEQKYLSVQSLRLYDGVVNGEMGAQVRQLIQEEHKLLSRRRKLAEKQNIATLAAIASTVGAVAVASQGGGSDCRDARTQEEYNRCARREYNRGRQQGAATQALISGAIFSVQEARRQNRLSKGAARNYVQSVMPALNASTEVQVDLIDSNETITAIRFEDLKAKLAELYAENQRSLDTIATRCAYTARAGQGTWLGACENGVANGSGVGVYRRADGTLVEHYGYARAGRADGPGYRIVRAPEGSYSVEGMFSDGRANGPVKVVRSGEVQVRRYSNGEDVGAAPAGTVVATPFSARDRMG